MAYSPLNKQKKDPMELLNKICEAADAPVLAEPVSTEYEGIVEEAKK